MKHATEAILVGLAGFAALMGVAFAQDNLFKQHAVVFFVVLLVSTVLLMRRVEFMPAGTKGAPAEDPNAYMDTVVRYGVIATMFWGITGFLVGVVVASQLAWPDLNIEPWFNFGRMRPLHTSAVIFA